MELQEVYSEIKSLGGDVVALSVDDLQNALDLKEKHDIEFPVLYDTDKSVTRQWGLYDLLNDGVSAPATYILRTDGTVESVLVGESIADRPTTKSILDTLAGMARGTNPGGISGDSKGKGCVIGGGDTDDESAGDCDGPGPAGAIDPGDAQDDSGPPAVGNLTPDFQLPTALGQTISLGDYVGEQNVVFVFFRAWW